MSVPIICAEELRTLQAPAVDVRGTLKIINEKLQAAARASHKVFHIHLGEGDLCRLGAYIEARESKPSPFKRPTTDRDATYDEVFAAVRDAGYSVSFHPAVSGHAGSSPAYVKVSW